MAPAPIGQLIAGSSVGKVHVSPIALAFPLPVFALLGVTPAVLIMPKGIVYDGNPGAPGQCCRNGYSRREQKPCDHSLTQPHIELPGSMVTSSDAGILGHA